MPTDGAPAFVEITNSGAAPVSLDGATLRGETGATVDLPPGLAIAPGASVVVSFDDQQGVEPGVVHRPAAEFVAGEAGSVRLELPDGLADAVTWGEPDLGAVDLCRGGRCAPPAPGSVLARVPSALDAFAPAAWAPLDAALATPGSTNPRPPVSAFAAIPGLIFTAEPRFSWYSVPGAARYRLQVASDDAFASVVHETQIEATPGVRLEQLTVQGPLLPPGNYVWRVETLGASGEAAEFSEAMPFSVDPTRAVRAASGSSAQSLPARSAAPSRVPEGLLKVLDVPVLDHAKDTRMLVLEAPSENPLWSWDTPDYAGYPYCARAGVAMVNAFYDGKLSQDRIGYEVYEDLRDGPEYDLPVVGIDDSRTSRYSLPLALGTSGQYVGNPYEGRGEDDDACYRYITNLALEQCAAQCADRTTDECFQCSRAREREIGCPAEIAYPWRPDAIEWGTQTIVDFQREIDAGRPIIATNPAHLFLIVGYRLEGGNFFFFYQDEGGRREFQANALGLADHLDSYWLGLAPVKIGNDEPEVESDSDADGVVDFDEIHRFATDESKADSDGDGVGDKAEIRASVWDPQHGYHRAAAALEPTAGDYALVAAATNADLSGRDFDRDGISMEMDTDSDGGGCHDGAEDENFNGIRDGNERYNFDGGDDDCEVGQIEWAGTIKVENRYNGEAGRHRWHAEYRVKFLEVPTSSSRPGREIGSSFLVNDLVPIAFEYDMQADQSWDGEGFKVSYGGNNQIVSGDVTMAGRASRKVDGQLLSDSRIVLGSVLRLDAPAATPYDPPDSVTEDSYYDAYLDNAMQPTEPGWYDISIGFGGYDIEYDGEFLPPYKALSLYQGIRRGGMMPLFFADPDEDFVHWVPSWMPDGTQVVGRLDDPNQIDVRGRLAFPSQGPGGPEDRQQLTVEWAFTRTRQ